MSVNVTELVGKRALLQVQSKSSYSSNRVIDEYIILEISPSGNWLKLQRAIPGARFWVPITDVALIEELKTLRKEKPPQD